MSKERLAAFTDAVLAIIMTILVLELSLPKAANFAAVWDMRHSFAAYALSFFWLGTMWVSLHNEWHSIDAISKSVVWWSIVLLFFSSLIPYATKFVDENFMSETAQVFYGVIVLCVTVSNIGMNFALEKANKDNTELINGFKNGRKLLAVDTAIKVVGMIIGITLFPPAVMISVVLTMIIFLIVSHI